MVADTRADYTWGGGTGLLSERAGAVSRWYHGDATSGTRGLTDSAENPTDSLEYDAFGLPVNTVGNSVSPFRHKGGLGYRTDPDSGLLLLGVRYYDPSLGRFISRDPLGYGAGDVNLYRYAGNNPVNASDPTGAITWEGVVQWMNWVAQRFTAAVQRWAREFTDVMQRWAREFTAAMQRWAREFTDAMNRWARDFTDGMKRWSKRFRDAMGAGDGAPGQPPDTIYSGRELWRSGQEPGPYHNFPGSFDSHIIKNGERRVDPVTGYIEYTLPGNINGRNGTYEIGIRPTPGGGYGAIIHRFFRPEPK